MRKLMDFVRLDEAEAAADGDPGPAVLELLGAELMGQQSLRGLVVDVVRAGGPVRFSRRIWPELAAFHAVVSRWYDHDPTVDGRYPVLTVPGVTVVWTFAVTEHVGVERTPVWPDGSPTAGLKHVSLLSPTVPGPEFRASYRHHVELVHEHLPLVWRYVQNDVEGSGGPHVDRLVAISELSYRSDDDYARRWARGAESEAEFRSHEGFLDLPTTVTAICTEHVLRAPPGPS
jgi:hypothetical protein